MMHGGSIETVHRLIVRMPLRRVFALLVVDPVFLRDIVSYFVVHSLEGFSV
jgi:hypothetical protein